MKRRNPKKGGSFDYIKAISPKKTDTHGYSLNIAQSNQFCISPLLPRGRHYLELPKIHNIHLSKIKRSDVELQAEHRSLHDRLLLLGYQYNNNVLARESRKNLTVDKKDPKQYRRRNREGFFGRQIFVGSIIASFGIKEIVLEKKKISTYLEEGNNSRMIKEILRKRAQLIFVTDKNNAQFVWTRFCDHQISKLFSKFLVEENARKNPSKHQSKSSQADENQDSYGSENKKSQINELVGRESQNQFQKNEKLIITDFRYHNHLTRHYQISDKKSLFNNLRKYCVKNKLDVFSMVPVTFEVNNVESDLPKEISNEKTYFIKPGEDTNRGNGISIASGRKKIKQQVNNLFKQGKTALVQQYIEPLLYRSRKFDIRCYVLVLSFRGRLKAFWYKEGYVRTCSKQFTDDIEDQFAHLTNDAIQKKSPFYGKYQQSNKLSFSDLQTFLKSKEINFRDVYDNMKKLSYYSIKSAEESLTGEKNQFSFEIFGYDFLLDAKGKAWLIEINTNPCFEFTGSLTSRIIWHMMDNSMKIFLDPFFDNEESSISSNKEEFNRFLNENKYECLI